MHTDEHLLALLEKYDGWMKEGKIPYAGKILPIQEAFQSKQWILPTQQALQILRNARVFALAECTCRNYYQRCNHPLETCLLINDMADVWLEAGDARRISLEEVAEVLSKANKHGLVHQAAYNPEQYIWAVCSCCACCCYRLQILCQFGRDDLVVHSDYVAVQEEARCNECGLCVSRCIFGVRQMVGGRHVFLSERCFGCGLCAPACPEEAISLILRAKHQERDLERG
jgi:ferredoxin